MYIVNILWVFGDLKRITTISCNEFLKKTENIRFNFDFSCVMISFNAMFAFRFPRTVQKFEICMFSTVAVTGGNKVLFESSMPAHP